MIFSDHDYWIMAKTADNIGKLRDRCHGQLNNIIANIVTLDDPYYMRNLTPGTYAATLYYAPNANR